MNIVWAFCGILLLSAPVFGAPEYGSGSYFLRGEIRLPYGNIVEPVFVVVDNSSIKGPRQRVDYYDGLDSYFYFPKESATFQIVPTDYDVSCFASVGADVAVQNFFPDLSEYTLLSNDVDIRGVAAVQYQLIKYQVGRVNTYNFYHSNDGSMRPLRFHFIGYDELLGSHYDEYSFEYFDYQEGEIVIDVFDRLEKIKSTCEIFDESESGPSSGKKGIHPASAIELFPFSHKSDYLSKSFDDFKDVHGKSYDPLIDRYRQHIYVRNIREITSFNRKSRDFKMQLNKFADMLPKELKALRPNKGKVVPNNAMFTYTRPHRPKKLPSSWNWVTKGAVSEVKDQGICGSCWSFGSSESIEGALFLKTGNLTKLSAQALVDCSWAFGNNGCDGGLDFQAYEWIMKSGYIPTEESYPYIMVDGRCHYEMSVPGTGIKGYVNVSSGDVNALKHALIEHGPISVAIDASHSSFVFYSSGVYYEPKCGNTMDSLDHAVLLVGYGSENGEDYWLIKNSWSPLWGDKGYVKMSMKGNNCGVATQPTFVLL